MSQPLSLALIALLIICCSSNPQESQQQKKLRIQQQQLQVRDSINLRYGQNTQSVTFSLVHMSDFVVKSPQREEVKAVMHTYWREQNVYISSEYREGENIRVLVYEDNYRIIHDLKFYVSYGFQFVAEPNKIYTVRFIDEGRIGKLIALEMSKTLTNIDDKASKQHVEGFNERLSSLQYELKVLSGISQFGIVLHEKNSKQLNHGICIYMTYLLIEAGIVIIIVSLQVKFLLKMLSGSSIV